MEFDWARFLFLVILICSVARAAILWLGAKN